MNPSLPQNETSDGPAIESGIPLLQRIYSIGTLRYTFAGLCIVFCWLLLGDFAISMRDRSMDPMVKLMLRKYQASDFRMTLLTTVLPMSVALFLAPVISFNSDRHRGRWGRRIPYLLIPTPIVVLSMLGLAYCPDLAHQLARTLRVNENSAGLSLFSVFWTLFEFAVIIAGAVFGGLINDVVPRQFLGRFFGLFRAVSLGAGIVFNQWLIGTAEQHFFGIFVGMGILFGAGVTIMCLMVKEGGYPLPLIDPNDPRTRGLFNNIRIYFEECYCHSYYLWIFLAFFFANTTFGPFNAFSLYYAKSIRMDLGLYGRLISGSYVISLLLAVPLGMLVDRFHALRVAMVTLGIYASSVLYGWLFVHDPRTFAVALVAHTILSGTYFTASASLALALYPRAKFGQYLSAGGVLGSILGIAWNFCMGKILDLSQHNYRLTFMMGLVFCCISLALLFVVHAQFKKHGGPGGYIAPEPDDADPLEPDRENIHRH